VLPRASAFALLLTLLACAPMGHAANEPAATHATVREGVPLKVANRKIIVLRGPIAGFTASERVAGASDRIEQAFSANPQAAVSTEETPEGTRILVGGKHAFMVTKIDIDPQSGETTQFVAAVAMQLIQQALAERREQETPRYLGVAAAYVGVATLLFAALIWLILGSNRWIGARLSVAAAHHSEKLQVAGQRLFATSSVLTLTRRLISLAAWIVAVVLTSAWLGFVLERFPYTRPWGEQLAHHLLDVIRQIVLAVAGAMPGLLFAALIFLVARTVVRGMSVFFDRIKDGNRTVGWIDADTAKPTMRISSFIIWMFALAIAYPYLPGAQTDAFKGISVLIGLMASMGAASVVGQAFNGFILMYSRAYRQGDYVRIGDNEGTVRWLGTFVTRIRTGLGEELTIPNSVVMAGSVRNYSRAVAGSGCVIDTTVTIGYSTPWRQVHAMLEEAAHRTADIAAEPAPRVRQLALSDFYVEYRLIASTSATDPAHRADVLNRLLGSIQDVFNEHSVQIMSPHYMMDPKEPQVVPRDKWHTPPAKE
jgi:small-conductance mechanosensitive channel